MRAPACRHAVASAVYDAANRVTSWGGTSVVHDLNGNLVADGATSYTWDARDRLMSLTGPGVTAGFSYDAAGRRTSANVNGTTTGFLYDGWNPVQEQMGGTPSATLLTGLGIDEYL